MNGFNGDDYEFAAGSVHGIRSWSMDDLGRLHGVTHAEVWRPGENVAVCKQSREIPCPNPVAPRDHKPKAIEAPEPKKRKKGRNRSVYDPIAWQIDTFPEYGLRPRCGEPTCYAGKHTVASEHSFDSSCSCGFWAYNDYAFAEHGTVTGIIEGYGKTSIGTRGFRCEKARIVALCRERKEAPLSLSTWTRLQQLYPEAVFFESRDVMVSEHGSVLRSWAEVDDGFWDQPVKQPAESFVASYARLTASFRAASNMWTRP